MSESADLSTIDSFLRGIAVGATLLFGLGVWRSSVPRSTRLVSLAAAISVAAWLLTEADGLWAAFDHSQVLNFLAYPISGLFWLFIVTSFQDRPVTPARLLPAIALTVTGMIMTAAPKPLCDWIWAGRNVFSGLLSLHAMVVIARGWPGDLLEARRRLRAPILGLGAAFGVMETILALGNRIHSAGSLILFDVGEIYGGAILAVLTLAMGAVFLQGRPEVFGPSRRAEPAADPRAEAADRLTLQRLDAAMAAEGWRREGLTIGTLAGELEIPEHRLRRLINNRLGHRNFADFLNAYRIEAAKRRLADPREARTNVATVAFDLGYGSLGPFNRAFRAATGSTPSEWRRQALAEASPELREAV